MSKIPINETNNLSIKEILEYGLEDRKGSRFNASANSRYIQDVDINGNTFSDYSAFSFVWEKSYIKSPERSGDGSIGNLNSYATFITPHLKIDFSMMSIDSYRKLMELIYSSNEFIVNCYDVVNNRRTTNRMYFSTEEMPKLWAIARALNGEQWVELLGVQDYTVEMIGTNVAVDKININYYSIDPNISDSDLRPTDYVLVGSKQVDLGLDILVGDGIVPNSYVGYEFAQKWGLKSRNGTNYPQNSVFNVGSMYEEQNPIDQASMSINFYAVYENSGLTLSFNYGLGGTIYDDKNNPINSIRFNTNQKLGDAIEKANKLYRNENGNILSLTTLPNSPSITVQKENANDDLNPYTFDGWFTTISGGAALTNDSVLTSTVNQTIYQRFTPKNYIVTFQSNGGTQFGNIEVPYKSVVAMPTPFKAGYVFAGWHLENTFRTRFNGNMPPRNITLYAKWE